ERFGPARLRSLEKRHRRSGGLDEAVLPASAGRLPVKTDFARTGRQERDPPGDPFSDRRTGGRESRVPGAGKTPQIPEGAPLPSGWEGGQGRSRRDGRDQGEKQDPSQPPAHGTSPLEKPGMYPEPAQRGREIVASAGEQAALTGLAA